MKFLVVFIALILMSVLHSCVKDTIHPVPSVLVNFVINIESPEIPIHGHAFFSGGFGGVVVFRKSIDEFVAFDRACPHHPFDPCGRITRVDTPIARCICCNSWFSLFDGSVVSGPSRYPLKQYRTSFQHPLLRVTGW